MKKKNLKLDNIKVESFVTETEKNKIKGGTGEDATQVGCTYIGFCK